MPFVAKVSELTVTLNLEYTLICQNLQEPDLKINEKFKKHLLIECWLIIKLFLYYVNQRCALSK